MEGHRQLDPAGGSGTLRRLVTAAVVVLWLAGVFLLNAAENPQQSGRLNEIQKLFEAKRWQQVVEMAQAHRDSGADIDYFLGVSLAQLERWDEARSALLRGWHLRPGDARFAVELGGVAFRQKRYAAATKWLRRGLRLNPTDAYTADFLGTVYYLQGNLQAALKYWNRIAKPRIENVRTQSGLQTDPVLLDRAFAFAPGDTLHLSELLTTQSRIHGLGVFPVSSIRLEAREDGRFDAVFAARERNGFGNGTVDALLSIFRGVGFQTVYPEYFNAGRSAINVTSLLRWDPRKRRLQSSISGPLRREAKRRYWIGLDLRDESWDLRSSSREDSLSLGRFRLRRNAVAGGVSSFRNDGWSWSAGGELSHRRYLDVIPSSGLPQDVLLDGYQLKQTAKLNRELWLIPERRFESSASISSELATIRATPAYTFERLEGSFLARWFPRMTGNDYATQLQVRAGKVFGRAPLDELFLVGMERDSDLWMRAHPGTRDGRKGSSPLGSQYFLSNWEMDKNLYSNGVLSVQLGPFADVGRVDSALGPATGRWLLDTGVQAKLHVMGVGLVFIYGKDVRTGSHAFYVAATP